MIRKTMILMLAGLALMTCSLLWAANTNDPISQGDFAVLLASNLKAPVPAGGWTPTSAGSFLSSLGLSPLSGMWDPAAKMNDGNLVHILRLMGQPYYSPEPDSIVTWGKAYAVMAQFTEFFATYPVHAMASSDDTTTHISTGMGMVAAGAPAPASPSRP